MSVKLRTRDCKGVKILDIRGKCDSNGGKLVTKKIDELAWETLPGGQRARDVKLLINICQATSVGVDIWGMILMIAGLQDTMPFSIAVLHSRSDNRAKTCIKGIRLVAKLEAHTNEADAINSLQ